MTAFEYMDYQQKISYYGVDKNRYWEKIHNFIEADFDSGRTKFARDINVLTYFDENRIKRCNVIIIQYLISFFFDTVGSEGLRSWFSQLAESIVRNKPQNSSLLMMWIVLIQVEMHSFCLWKKLKRLG